MKKQIDDRFRDTLLIACASTMKAYCEETDCIKCPFHDNNFKLCTLRDFVPAYWELPITYIGGVKK